MAIQELSEPLQKMIDNDELRIVTQDEGAGTTLIKNWVIAWLHSGNKSKMMAVFDKDLAGGKAFQEIKNNTLYASQNQKTSVKVIQLELSKNIIELYRAKLHIPIEIEHLLSPQVWKKAIEKKYTTPRTAIELLNAYKGQQPRDKSIDFILDEKIDDSEIRETIANYNPHEYKKMEFCKMVEQMYYEENVKDIFWGGDKTILKIEQFFT